jgi:hypothetical protein
MAGYRYLSFFLFLFVSVIAVTPMLLGAIEVGGSLDNDTVWTASDTIEVVATVTVTSSATLIIEPGTVVIFKPDCQLRVYGVLLASGQSGYPITFASAADTTTGDVQSWAWPGLQFDNSGGSVLEYCHIRLTYYGIKVINSIVEIRDCTIEDFFIRGIYLVGANTTVRTRVRIESCRIAQTIPDLRHTGTGVWSYGTVDVDVYLCHVSNCYDGIEVFGYKTQTPQFSVCRSHVSDHHNCGIYIHSSG